jgi:hypothetical protein
MKIEDTNRDPQAGNLRLPELNWAIGPNAYRIYMKYSFLRKFSLHRLTTPEPDKPSSAQKSPASEFDKFLGVMG